MRQSPSTHRRRSHTDTRPGRTAGRARGYRTTRRCVGVPHPVASGSDVDQEVDWSNSHPTRTSAHLPWADHVPGLGTGPSQGQPRDGPTSWGPPPLAIRQGYRDDVHWQYPISRRDWSPAFVCRHLPSAALYHTLVVHVNGDCGAPALFRGWYTARHGRRWRGDVPSLRLGPSAPDHLESSCDPAPQRAYQQSGLVRSRSASRSFLRQRALVFPCLKGRSTLAPALLSKYVTRPACCDCARCPKPCMGSGQSAGLRCPMSRHGPIRSIHCCVSQVPAGLGPHMSWAVSHIVARANPPLSVAGARTRSLEEDPVRRALAGLYGRCCYSAVPAHGPIRSC